MKSTNFVAMNVKERFWRMCNQNYWLGLKSLRSWSLTFMPILMNAIFTWNHKGWYILYPECHSRSPKPIWHIAGESTKSYDWWFLVKLSFRHPTRLGWCGVKAEGSTADQNAKQQIWRDLLIIFVPYCPPNACDKQIHLHNTEIISV